MKSLNVKKLAALAVGATMVLGTAAAAVANNLPTDRSWYLDSKIVVGSGAAASDVVSAAEISAAIAQLAYKKAEIQATTGEAKVKIETPGTVSVGGQGYTDENYMNLAVGNYDFSGTFGNTKIPTLASSQDISFKYYDGSQWQDADGKYTENISVLGDVQEGVPSGSSKADVRFVAAKDGMKYTYTLSGVVGDELELNHDYQVKNLYVDLLGKKFEVTDIDLNSSPYSITLVSSQKTATVEVGSSVDYEGYKIEVGDIDPDQGTAYLKLLDENGNVVATDIVSAGGYTDFDGTLPDSIKVDAVFAGTTSKFAKLELTADKLVLNKGDAKDFPDADGWKISWNLDPSNNIVFTVYYDGDENSTYLNFDSGLKVGDTFKFPGSAGYGVVFQGFEPQPTKTLSIDGSKITYIGGDGATHTAILYTRIPKTAVTDDTNNDIVTFTVSNLIDDKDYKFSIEYNDTTGDIKDMNLYEGSDTTPIQISDSDIYGKSATINLSDYGTSFVLEDFNKDATDYVAEIFFNSNDAPTTLTSDEPYSIAFNYDNNVWTVGTIGGQDVNVPFDKSDFKVDFKDYDVSVSAPAQKLDSDDTTDNPANWWLNDGTYVDIADSSSLKIVVPTQKEKGAIFVGIPQSVSTGQGYVELTAGQTIPGTDYKIVDIETGAPKVSGTYYEEVKDLDPTSMVYLDTQEPSGNLIVVGGYAINKIAAKIQQLKQDLTKENTKVVKYYPASETGLGSDAIVVAGWTADDTMAAAREFINFLKTSVQ